MSPIRAQLPLDIKLRVDATLANYIGDAGGRLLAADGVVVLWGEPGSGRSHLLQSSCHEMLARRGSAIYLSELDVYSAEILSGLESLDLICLDDVHTIAGEDDWEVALFHLVNDVRDRGGKLIVSSNQPIGRVDIQLKDLKSRLTAAHSIETDRLQDAEKIRLLQEKAARQGFELGEEVGRYIISRANRDIRSLVALMDRLELETLRYQKRVTIPFVKQVLEA